MGLEEVAKVNHGSVEAKTVTRSGIGYGGQDCKKTEDKIVTRSATAIGSLSWEQAKTVAG